MPHLALTTDCSGKHGGGPCWNV